MSRRGEGASWYSLPSEAYNTLNRTHFKNHNDKCCLSYAVCAICDIFVFQNKLPCDKNVLIFLEGFLQLEVFICWGTSLLIPY